MKKILIGALAALIIACGVILATDWCLPGSALDAHAGSDGTLWLCETTPLFSTIYGANPEGNVTDLYRVLNRSGDEIRTITQATGDTQFLYYVEEYSPAGSLDISGWRLYKWARSSGDITDLGSDPNLSQVTDLVLSGGTLWVAGLNSTGSAALLEMDTTASNPAELALLQAPAEGSTIIDVEIYQNNLLLYMDDGSADIVSSLGSYSASGIVLTSALYATFGYTFTGLIQCKAPLLIGAVIVILALTVLYALFYLLASRAKRLAFRSTAVAGGCLLLALVVAWGGLLVAFGASEFNSAYTRGAGQSQAVADAINAFTPSFILQDDFRTSSEHDLFANLLGEHNELYAYSNSTLTVALSQQNAYGANAMDTMDEDLLALAQSAARGSTYQLTQMDNNRLTTFTLQPVYANGVAVGVLVARSAGDSFLDNLPAVAVRLGLFCLLVLVVFALILYVTLTRVTRPIRTLTRQMEKISDGDFTAPEITICPDELGEMSRAMQEMCMGLSIRDYEINATIQSYHRFVPQGLESLLDRASIMEVGFGDAKTTTGNMGMLTVNNRDIARNLLDDSHFVAFVNNCYSAIQTNLEEYGGYLLSAGFDIAALKCLYRGTAATAVQSALSLLGDHKKHQAVDGIAPQFFLMLHNTSFLYGIAGTEETVFPFLSSSEMEFMTALSAKFYGTGATVVLTEPFLKQIEGEGYATRYVGYVSSPDGQFSYKLYEVLDTYPDIERNLRIRYDQRLQEAIGLFYRNDFYLARNLFSTLLRASPDDGIVRWYLFACEHFFNCEDMDQVTYQLFGVDE